MSLMIHTLGESVFSPKLGQVQTDVRSRFYSCEYWRNILMTCRNITGRFPKGSGHNKLIKTVFICRNIPSPTAMGNLN